MGKHILVVDDDQSLRCLLQQLLESEGYEVDTASDGQVAWEKLDQQAGAYEVVILDMQMPRMDGLQLLQALRQQEAGRVSPVLAMSASREALHQAAELRVSRVLVKPFDLDAVLTQVASCLGEQAA